VREPAERTSSKVVLLLSVATVLVSVPAGYLLWWTTTSSAKPAAPTGRNDDAALEAVVLRPVEYAPGVTADERDGIDRATQALFPRGDAPEGRDRASLAEEALVAHGEAAVPRLLTALHELHERDGFEGGETRARAERLDRILARIRRAMPTSAAVGAAPLTGQDAPAAVLRRVRAWFLWWERRFG
jgi:hypothetical protein